MLKKMRCILKDLFRPGDFKRLPIKENAFLDYHGDILRKRIAQHADNCIVFDKEKNPGAMALFEYLPWDTGIFKMKIGRMDYFICRQGYDFSCRQKVVKESISLAKRLQLKFMSARINLGDFKGAQVLENFGFVLCDVLVNLTVVPAGLDIKKTLPSKGARIYRRADLPQILKIAESSFVFNRFFNDERLKKDNVKTMYVEWAKNVCLNNGSNVLAWERSGKVSGFVLCKFDSFAKKRLGFNIGQIDLVAVDPKEKGKGIGIELIKYALHKFDEAKVGLAEIRTQQANVPAVNSFLKAGFKAYGHGISLPAGLMFHKWFD